MKVAYYKAKKINKKKLIEKWEKQMFKTVVGGINEFEAMRCAVWARTAISQRTLGIGVGMSAVILFTDLSYKQGKYILFGVE